MDDYKFEMRKEKRGLHCLINFGNGGMLCGCGCRDRPTKKQKTRIVKRALKNAFNKEMRYI